MTNPTKAYRVSLIVTVLNEATSISSLLDSISGQTRPPDEVVIADGGSRDGTPELIRVWGTGKPFPVQVLVVPGANIARGRNAAIEAARYDWIACTDAGVRLDPAWLERLLAPLQADRQAGRPTEAVSGFFVPDPRSTFELAMGATVLPAVTDVDPARFLPSSRSILFAKSAWRAADKYPEWLDYCEDLVFDLALSRRTTFAFAPGALVYFRPRSSLRSFFHQYYRYARGDGKADLWRKRHAIRYGIYLVVLPVMLVLGAQVSSFFWLLIFAGGFEYIRDPYRRLLPALARLRMPQKLYALGLVPVIRVLGDVAKMLGYPAGVAWRLRNPRPKPSPDGLRGR